MTSAPPIYKIASLPAWRAAEAAGRFDGAPVDRADGFIHFSAAAQVRETARRHFAEAGDLVLVTVDPSRLGDTLRWEPSRGGELFPHLYGPLPMETVLSVEALTLDAGGLHVFPAFIP